MASDGPSRRRRMNMEDVFIKNRAELDVAKLLLSRYAENDNSKAWRSASEALRAIDSAVTGDTGRPATPTINAELHTKCFFPDSQKLRGKMQLDVETFESRRKNLITCLTVPPDQLQLPRRCRYNGWSQPMCDPAQYGPTSDHYKEYAHPSSHEKTEETNKWLREVDYSSWRRDRARSRTPQSRKGFWDRSSQDLDSRSSVGMDSSTDDSRSSVGMDSSTDVVSGYLADENDELPAVVLSPDTAGESHHPPWVLRSAHDANENSIKEFLAHLEENEVRELLLALESRQKNIARAEFGRLLRLLHPPQENRALGTVEEDFEWTKRFTAATKNIYNHRPNLKRVERMQNYRQLTDVGHSFLDTARRYATIIISEVGLDPRKKTIEPLQNQGYAGGEKYLVQGIYFKLAVANDFENRAFRPVGADGNEDTIRLAGHDLRHLTAVFNVWGSIRVGMVATLDYCGFRVLACSVLPISGRQTLRLGCDNAVAGNRKEVLTGTRDKQIKSAVQRLGRKFNLKRHPFHSVVRDDDGSSEIYTGIDVEFHRGTDEQIYVVDCARVFPCVDPNEDGTDSADKRAYLTRLFRPEFVKSYKKNEQDRFPLNPDAFSPFSKKQEDEEDIKEATLHLRQTVCSKFARHLLVVRRDLGKGNYPLAQMCHFFGINLRYLGIVRNMVGADQEADQHVRSAWRHDLLMEIVVRTAKQLIRRRLRHETYARNLAQNSEPWRSTIVQCFNHLFQFWSGKEEEKVEPNLEYWNFVETEARRRFPQCLDGDEGIWSRVSGNRGHILRKLLLDSAHLEPGECAPPPQCALFKDLVDQLGLSFRSHRYEAACSSAESFQGAEPFSETDFVGFLARPKNLNIVAHSEGFLTRQRALDLGTSLELSERVRVLNTAIGQFRQSLRSDPTNIRGLSLLAESLACAGRIREAEFYFQAALKSCWKPDTTVLFKFAVFLEYLGLFDDAEELYLRSLKANPEHANCLLAYADFLCEVREDESAAEPIYGVLRDMWQ